MLTARACCGVGRCIERTALRWLLTVAVALTSFGALVADAVAGTTIDSIVVKLRDGVIADPLVGLPANARAALEAALQVRFVHVGYTSTGALKLELPNAVPLDAARAALNRARLLPQVLYANLAPAPPALAEIAATPSTAAQQPPVHRLIVKFRDLAASAAATRNQSPPGTFVNRLSTRAGQPVTHERAMSGGSHVVRLFRALPADAARALASQLATDAAIEYVEPDLLMQPTLVPNDPLYTSQWHLLGPPTEIGGANLAPAWNLTTGAAGVVVAVIDTGSLPAHPDLAGRYIGGYDFVSSTLLGNDGDARDADPSDPGDWISLEDATSNYGGCPIQNSSFHGAHVAGIVGAASGNANGVAGVNWTSRILPARVLGKCGGFTSDIVDAIRWSAGVAVPGVPSNPNPARVLNMSLGTWTLCTTSMQSAIDAALATGAVVVVSAGNNDRDASVSTPGNCNGVITVGATGRAGQRASYSNFGPLVEISAPGGSDSEIVLSTVSDSATTPALGNYTYGYKQGTSMAAPQVAGIVSLMLSRNPLLTPGEVLAKIQATARPFPTFTIRDCSTALCGAGIVDAGTAVAAALNEPPTANFSFSASGLTASFTDTSTDSDGSIASRSWSFGDGSTSTAANPSKTYAAANTYLVTLTVTDNAGASASVSKSVTVVPANVAPTANFSFTTSGLAASFTDTSTDSDGSIAARSWSFGDGSTSTAANPSKTYAAANTYLVTLTVTDNAGASASVTKPVTVVPANVAPTANFSFTTSGLAASFTDTSTDSDGSIASRSWSFGDGSASTATNPSRTYAAGGTYNVTLTVTDNAGASASASKSVTVSPANVPPTANFSFTTSGLTASFTDTSTDSDGAIAARSWSFGDGSTSTATNPSRTYAAANTYLVTLTVTDNAGASASVTTPVTVVAPPPPPPPANTLTKDVPVTGLAGNTATELRYTMAVPAGATNLTFTTSGGTGDADLFVSFGSAPTSNEYDCRSYNTGNEETCSFATARAGTYHVMVRGYRTFDGVSLTGSYSGGIANVPPTANFSFATSGLTASFTNTSTDSDGTIASRSWSFGDGSTSTATNPSRTYAGAGTYNVTLTVTDNAGASASVTKQVTVSGPANVLPTANFSFSTSGLTASFTDTSTDSDGTIASRSWSFGDGSTSTAANPSRTYAAGGTYNVTLTVTDNVGASASVTKQVTVSGPANVLPTANFSFSTSGLTASFTDTSTDADGAIAARSWSFGDGSASTATNPSRTYAGAGTYSVTLTVTDNAGASASVSKSVTVAAANIPPTANFSFSTTGLTASFTDTSTDSDGAIASRSWSFGDGSTSTATNPSRTYAAANTYLVTLTVTDNAGASASVTKAVTASAPPPPPPPASNVLANGVPVTGLAGNNGTELRYTMAVPAGATNLTFATSGGTGDADLFVRFGSAPTFYEYDCRSFNAGNDESCSFASAQAGTYHVMVRGYRTFDGVSLTGSFSGGVANVPPTANFSFNTSALAASFTDTSTDSDGTIASRSWSFGDGSTATATNPSRTYAAGGTYNVTLTVTDNAGASASVTKPVTVVPANVPPTANFSFSTTGLTAGFTDISTDSDGTIASRSWSFGDGSTATATNPSRTYAAGGTYNVTLTVTDNAGASASVSKSVTVSPANVPPTANFSFTTSGLTASFTDTSTDSDGAIAARSWGFGDGSTSTATNPSRTYAAANTYLVTLTVTDNAGVSASVSKSVTVAPANVPPTANFSFTTTGLAASFTDTSTDSDGSIAARSWSFGDGSTATAANPSKTYATAGTYNVTLTVTDNAGASASVTKPVTVVPANVPPTANFSFSTTGLTAGFTDTSTDSDGTIAARSWSFGDGSTSTATNPSRTYAAAGTYNVTLTVTDNAGTSASVTKPVSVSGAPNVPPTANFSFTTSGLTASFTDTSIDNDGTIASRSWSFGDGSTSTTTNPSRTYAAAGTYNVTLTVMDNAGSARGVIKPVTVSLPPAPLTNGTPVTGLAGVSATELRYTMAVPAGVKSLTFTLAGGTGDADLYVRFGAAPTFSDFDCRPYLSTSDEGCTFSPAQAGTYHIMVRGYSTFSGASLTGNY